MPQPQRVTIEQIIAAYQSTGSVWKAAKRLGVVGQSVWERLKAIDYPIHNQVWTEDEIAELASLSQMCTLGDIARRLGRPYYGVAIKVSRMGLASRAGNKMKKKLPRGTGLTKPVVHKICKDLEVHPGTLRQFARMKGYDLEILVQTIQRYDMEFWKRFSESRTDLEQKKCDYCDVLFFPMSGKQVCCSRKCTADKKRDANYFGGRRRDTIGLAEGVCQLCEQPKSRGLSSHHVLGKENDPDNEYLIALCQGCHNVLTKLAGRRFVDRPEGWQNLIHLVMARRFADVGKGFVGAEVHVQMEYLTAEDVQDMEEHGQEVASFRSSEAA